MRFSDFGQPCRSGGNTGTVSSFPLSGRAAQSCPSPLSEPTRGSCDGSRRVDRHVHARVHDRHPQLALLELVVEPFLRDGMSSLGFQALDDPPAVGLQWHAHLYAHALFQGQAMTVRRFIDVLNRGALVAPGVVACKDGSVPAGWQVAGRLRHPGIAL